MSVYRACKAKQEDQKSRSQLEVPRTVKQRIPGPSASSVLAYDREDKIL